MMISIPPKYAVSQVVGYIKGKSAIHLARVIAHQVTKVARQYDISSKTSLSGVRVTLFGEVIE
jgi:REP element-mobilizing transposase RayT